MQIIFYSHKNREKEKEKRGVTPFRFITSPGRPRRRSAVQSTWYNGAANQFVNTKKLQSTHSTASSPTRCGRLRSRQQPTKICLPTTVRQLDLFAQDTTKARCPSSRCRRLEICGCAPLRPCRQGSPIRARVSDMKSSWRSATTARGWCDGASISSAYIALLTSDSMRRHFQPRRW